MADPLQIVSVIVLIKCGGKFLLVRRSDGDDIFPGFWQNMGGKIEVGERVEEAIGLSSTRFFRQLLKLDLVK